MCVLMDKTLIPSLTSCRTEFLCVYFTDLTLVLLMLYHPFWNDRKADDDAIDCISDVVDFSFIKYGSSCKFVVCGDFNDLHKSFSTIANLTQLFSLVDLPTLFGNFLMLAFLGSMT